MTVDDVIIKDATKAVTAAHERGDRLGEAQALIELRSILSGLGRSAEARAVSEQLEPFRTELLNQAEQAVHGARERGDLRAEVQALFRLSRVLHAVASRDDAARAEDRAKKVYNKWITRSKRELAQMARQTAAQAIARARERGDRQAEAAALFTLSRNLRDTGYHDKAAHTHDQATRIDRELKELRNRELAQMARQTAAQAIALARERGDQQAECAALFTLGRNLRGAGYHDEAAQAHDQATRIDRELKAPRAEKARQSAAQAIALARERGDQQAEAAALFTLGRELRDAGRHDEAAHADEQARQIENRQRAFENLETAARTARAAQAGGDRAAEALALLTRAKALLVLERPTEAETTFHQAEELAAEAATATLRTAAEPGHRAEQLAALLRTLVTLGNALRDVRRDEAAQAIRTAVSTAKGHRTVSNQISGSTADAVVQVGVVHGDVRINTSPRVPATAIQVSVTTKRHEVAYHYDGHTHHVDSEVCVLVEAYTAQAVILRQLRPVVVRRISRFDRIDPTLIGRMQTGPRRFSVRLDARSMVERSLPSTSVYADLDGQTAEPVHASPAGEADFPFHVTASDPEYFVIRPDAHSPLPVEWWLELDWSCLGQHGTVTIDHGDRPFLFARR